MICNAKFYSLTLQTEKKRLEGQAEKQIRKPGGSKSTLKTSNSKEHGINHIDIALLFNETVSEMKIFSAANPHMVLFGERSPVTALRRTEPTCYQI